ncbi:MAG: TfoX/Sxy family protein [Nitrospirae bacterium]|nr:TfoX/Sxy family protein [Nitrospirota bacterium]
MAVTPQYRDYVVEQLSCVGRVAAWNMFGGVGLYLDGVFFGLIAHDVLYLKVDDANRPEYEAAGMGPFKPYPNRRTTMPYYELPAEVLDDADQLREWTRKARDAANRARTVRGRR